MARMTYDCMLLRHKSDESIASHISHVSSVGAARRTPVWPSRLHIAGEFLALSSLTADGAAHIIPVDCGDRACPLATASESDPSARSAAWYVLMTSDCCVRVGCQNRTNDNVAHAANTSAGERET